MKINSTEVKNLEPIETIALSHRGEYAGIADAFEKLVAWATEMNLWANNPKMAGVYHDDPNKTPTEELRSEACLENVSGVKPAEGMHSYTISGGRYFVMQVELSMSEYGEAWQKAYTAFNEKGYTYDTRDHYELYIACDSADENATSVVELRIPMK